MWLILQVDYGLQSITAEGRVFKLVPCPHMTLSTTSYYLSTGLGKRDEGGHSGKSCFPVRDVRDMVKRPNDGWTGDLVTFLVFPGTRSKCKYQINAFLCLPSSLSATLRETSQMVYLSTE